MNRFAGPAAQGVSDSVLELLSFDLFDNCSLPGAQVGEMRCVGYRLDTSWIPVVYRCGRKSLQNRLVALLGRPKSRPDVETRMIWFETISS